MADHVQLIASDLDGTLFGPDHQLSARTIRAVQSAVQAGIRVVAATGRSSQSAIPLLRPAGVIEVAVCSNGSLVHEVMRDVNVARFPIEHRHVERFFQALAAFDEELSYCWETDHGNGWDDGFADIAHRHADLGHQRGLDIRPRSIHRTTKIMVRHPSHSREALRSHLLPHLTDDLSVSCSGVDFVEVTGVGVHKASGLQHLCTQWSIDPEHVVAFGDNQNDIEMLRWAGRGYAMENASGTAKEAADEIIGHHANDAVAKAIESIVAARSK